MKGPLPLPWLGGATPKLSPSRCGCGRFAKTLERRPTCNGSFTVFFYRIRCSRCGVVTFTEDA